MEKIRLQFTENVPRIYYGSLSQVNYTSYDYGNQILGFSMEFPHELRLEKLVGKSWNS